MDLSAKMASVGISNEQATRLNDLGQIDLKGEQLNKMLHTWHLGTGLGDLLDLAVR